MEEEKTITIKFNTKKRHICPFIKDTCPSELLKDWCVEIEKRDCPRFKNDDARKTG